MTGTIEHGLRAISIHTGLVADNLEANDPLLQRRIVQIRYACLDSVV
ncbi:MAG: hypothetical protein WCY92_02915 [Novosphingobium sp.]